MKVSELLNEGMREVGDDIVDQLNTKVSEIAGTHTGIFDRKAPGRTWTRGDGVRYRDPTLIHIYGPDWKHVTKKFPQVLKKFKHEKGAMDFAEKFIRSLPGIKHVGKIKGEFGSDKYADAYKYKNVIFIRRGNFAITMQSPSVLRNVDVWKKEDASE